MAAEQGLPAAQYNLGFMYERGEGVGQDYAEAAHWFRRAAEQGEVEAQNNLGVLYAAGRGVQRDFVQAYMWFELAAAGGNEKARQNRDRLARTMSLDEIAEARLLASEWGAEWPMFR